MLFLYPYPLASVYFVSLGANWACFMCLQLPEEAKELDKEVRQIVKEKDEAVRNQDYEKVLSSIRKFCLCSKDIVSPLTIFKLTP